MEREQEGYSTMEAVVKGQAMSRTVSKYMKRKIPGELRAKWYTQIVVPALIDYNDKCKNWLKENVK